MSLPSLGQTSQDITSDHEVLPTAEEPITGDPEVNNEWSQDPSLEEPITGDPQIDDDWSDDVFQDLVGDLSEWSADVLQALNTVNVKFNDDSFQTPAHVVPDMSDDVAEASDRLAEDTVASQLSQQRDNEKTIMGQFAKP